MPSRADEMVSSLRSFIAGGGRGLKEVPGLIKIVVDEELWRERVIDQTRQVARFDRFEQFVATDPLEGLGADVPTLRRLCGDDPAALDALDRATGHNQGERTDLLNNIQEVREPAPAGTSLARALRRLRNDRPDLHARVLARELSPHGAMVEAGFRPKTATVPLEVPDLARAIRRRLTPDQIAELVALLTEVE